MCYKHNDDDVDYDYDVVLLFEKWNVLISLIFLQVVLSLVNEWLVHMTTMKIHIEGL